MPDSAILAAIIGATATIAAALINRTRKDKPLKTVEAYVRKKMPLFLLPDSSKAKPIYSNGNSSSGEVIPADNGFSVKVHPAAFSDYGMQNFVMALIQYTPYRDWSLFCENNYALSFDINFSQGIKAVQLEVKNEGNQGKLIDEKIGNLHLQNTQHVSLTLSNANESESFQKVHEVCFTVFIDSAYINVDHNGDFTVSNLALIPI